MKKKKRVKGSYQKEPMKDFNCLLGGQGECHKEEEMF